MGSDRIDEEYYLVKRIDARYIREQEFYPDGKLKRDYTLTEPVKSEKGYPQMAELGFVVMVIVFLGLSIAIITAKPTTKTEESSKNSGFRTHLAQNFLLINAHENYGNSKYGIKHNIF